MGATTEQKIELDKQIAAVQDRIDRGSPLTNDEKNSKHYNDHLKDKAKELEGNKKWSWLHGSARKAAAKHVKDKWKGKKTPAEETLASLAATYATPATPATPRPPMSMFCSPVWPLR